MIQPASQPAAVHRIYLTLFFLAVVELGSIGEGYIISKQRRASKPEAILDVEGQLSDVQRARIESSFCLYVDPTKILLRRI